MFLGSKYKIYYIEMITNIDKYAGLPYLRI